MTAVSADEVNKDMCVEWAQCVACTDRWGEEVILLQEEMRLVVQFLEWRSGNWFAKTDSRIGTTLVVRAGLSVYANKQGSVFHNLAVRFSQRWHSILISLSLPHAWASEFLDTHNEPLDNPDLKKCALAKAPSVSKARTKPPPIMIPAPADTLPLPATPASTDTPPLPATPRTISHKVDVDPTVDSERSPEDDSDEMSSEDDSGYESNSSFDK